jgi:hypothetical protein
MTHIRHMYKLVAVSSWPNSRLSTKLTMRYWYRQVAGWSPGPEKAAAFRDTLQRFNCRQYFLTAKPARLGPVPQV